MYLSSTEPPAAAEWACLLRPLRGREPEGIWNLLSIVREMFKRRDSNAAPLLEILTEQCLTYEQIISWWYSVRTSASHSSASGHTGRSNGQSEVAAHACASMCDEMVVLWRLAVLDPTMSPCRRLELAGQLKQWHLKVIEIVKRGQHRKSLDKLFQGFKPAVESCYFNWEVAYPLESITYCSADKKSATFCWSRAVLHQRGVKAAAGSGGETPEGGAGGRTEGGAGGDFKGRGHTSQQEVAVRPKETLLTKRKGLSVSGGGGVLVRLGGGVSLSLEDGGGKCMYKGPGSSSGGKLKLTQGGGKGASVGGPVGGSGVGGGKHASAKRRTSSEDSSLEPDLAELSLDDGCSLALGAEASNTFEFLPPPPEMLPSPSPLLRDSRKYSNSNGGSKTCETKRVSHASAALPASEPAPPCFPPKETVVVVMDMPSAAEKDAEQEVEPVQNKEEDVDSAGSNQPSTSIATVTSGSTQNSKPARGRREAGPAEAAAGSGGAANQAAEAAGGAAGGEPVGEDDYQAYYLSAASEEGADRQLAEGHQEEEPDIFAGMKPLEQEGRMEVKKEECSQSRHYRKANTPEPHP
ncbi:zinc finger SWIM domain-containing protein 8-like [Notothenia coriiceps]|uniref:Zinc finger SWIM domain-containing protein 8-like n=1 Tax=Notothenia coriiceps TaxID=8208 RepID=A0A6I9P3Y1_9TELE|nr:PREDICTED: zinc finger SWIM domain-containing protein 8-like [Notothenia coriiceps]